MHAGDLLDLLPLAIVGVLCALILSLAALAMSLWLIASWRWREERFFEFCERLGEWFRARYEPPELPESPTPKSEAPQTIRGPWGQR